MAGCGGGGGKGRGLKLGGEVGEKKVSAMLMTSPSVIMPKGSSSTPSHSSSTTADDYILL